ncbi:MAG: M1 family metallopeptidase [Anaerolineae bacterium]|nr:M1 family metallopeptidase [Anaerolineae bacterium]
MRKTILLSLLVVLVGCTPKATATLFPTATVPLLPTFTPTLTPTLVPTPTPTMTSIPPTMTPTVTPTHTHTPTPTPTPTPTLLPPVTSGQEVALASWARPMLDQLADLPGYEIQAQIDLETLTVAGHQRVAYTNRYDIPLTEVYFNLYPNAPRFGKEMQISNLKLNEQPIETIYEKERRALRVPFALPLPPGRQALIEMDFVVQVLSMDKSDLRPLVYSAGPYPEGILSLGGWYPMLAVLDEAGWHLDYHSEVIGEAMFADSAFYRVDLVAPGDLDIVATGVKVGETLRDDGLRAWSFVSGPVRSFYAVGAPDYEVVTGQLGEITVRSTYRTGHDICGQWVLEAAQTALDLYTELYGPYPFSEFDVVEADYDFQGFEWSGLIAIGDKLYGGIDPVCGEWFVAHETAHQWWYGVVGNDPVNHPWLDEALAQYTTMTYFRRLWAADSAQAYIDAIIYAKFEPFADDAEGLHIDRSTIDFETMKHYYAIVYARGAMFVDELNKQLGDEAFFAAMQQYYQQHMFGIAGPQDFYEMLSKADPEAVKSMWNEWVVAPAGE